MVFAGQLFLRLVSSKLFSAGTTEQSVRAEKHFEVDTETGRKAVSETQIRDFGGLKMPPSFLGEPSFVQATTLCAVEAELDRFLCRCSCFLFETGCAGLDCSPRLMWNILNF